MSYKAKRWVYDVRTIAEVEGAAVKAWRRAQWHEQILVPALPQSALPGCSLIHIDYYLQVLGWWGWAQGGAGAGGWCLTLSPPMQVSLRSPEATVTLPVFVGNVAVHPGMLSPQPGPGLSPMASRPVVPSAPPQEEAEATAGGLPFPDPIFLSTQSHSQQQAAAAQGSELQDGSPVPRAPPLCLSTGATVPYFAEGSGEAVATACSVSLPPEYSSWGYPCGRCRGESWGGRGLHEPRPTLFSPHRGPTVL